MRPVLLGNEALSVGVLPRLGGKLTSLRGLASGREHLLQPPENPWRDADYGAPFADYDTSGFDDCFPTVGACSLSDGTTCPDHGELWPLSWEVLSQNEASMALAARGRCFPYLFRRGISLQGSAVVLDYEVENTGEQAFPYLWSSHPLLQVAPGDQVELPAQVSSLRVEWSAGSGSVGK